MTAEKCDVVMKYQDNIHKRKVLNHNKNQYLFTFVRNPIDRFISAVNEIEMKAKWFRRKDVNEPKELKFLNDIKDEFGNEKIFQKYIDLILINFTNRGKYWNFIIRDLSHLFGYYDDNIYRDNHNIAHLAPQVGIFVNSKYQDVLKINLYRYYFYLFILLNNNNNNYYPYY